ncbi:MAG: MarR family winged helix-turn-helix transcriptional regulator [Gammaproteobacteria bacterium]
MSENTESIHDFRDIPWFLIEDVARLLRARFVERAGELSLNLGQLKVLAYVGRHGSISQIELAEILEVSQVAISKIVNGLCTEKFLIKRSNTDDRRVRRVALTPKGRALLIRGIALAAELFDVVRDVLGTRQEGFFRDLETLRGRLSEMALDEGARAKGMRRNGGRPESERSPVAGSHTGVAGRVKRRLG